MSANRRVSWVACALAVSAAAAAVSGEDAEKRLQKLSEQLRDSKPSKQEKAFAELEKLGPAALPAVAAAFPTASYPLSQRMEAYLKRAEPAALVRVIRASGDVEVRRRVTKLISDPTLLGELARGGPPEVAAAAVRGLTDPALLGAVAREAVDPETRTFARTTLADTAKKDPSPERRALAAAEVDDPATLAELAKTGGDSVRLAVLSRVDDPAVLKVVAVDAGARSGVRLAALARISDAATLAEIAKGYGPTPVRVAALQRVEDTALLAQLARSAGEPPVRIAAIRRVADPQVLLAAATGDSDEQVRLNAIALLKGRAALQQIAVNDKSADVKRVAGILARRPTRGRGWPQLVRDLGSADAAAARDAAELVKGAGAASLPVLAETLADPDTAVGEAAARELARLGEKAIPAVAAVLDNPAASPRALELLPRLSAKPIVAVVYAGGKVYGKTVQAKLEEALKARAFLIDCPASPACEAFPRRVRVAEKASDGDGCYDKTYFGGSYCLAASQNVRLEVGFAKGQLTLASQSFAAASPQKVPYTYYMSDTGPSSLDVQAATAKVLAQELAKLDVGALDRLLEP